MTPTSYGRGLLPDKSNYVDSLFLLNLWLAIPHLKFWKLALSTSANSAFMPLELPTPHYTALLLTLVSTFPTHCGFCWMSLFAEPVIGWDHIVWMPIVLIKKLAAEFGLNTTRKYNVWFSEFGLIHVELDYSATWSANDILSLPEWLLVGGTFMADALNEGYPQEFLNTYLYYVQDTRQPSPTESTGSSGSSGRLSTKSSTGGVSDGKGTSSAMLPHKQALMDILSTHHTQARLLQALRKYFSTELVTLSRIDMELIARAVDGYCYSACSASSIAFQEDLIRSAPYTGDTLDTFLRILRNDQNDKGKPVPNPVPKTLYIDMTHISRYPFDGSARIKTDDIATILDLLFQVKTAVRRTDGNATKHATESLNSYLSENNEAKYMALVYDIASRLEIDFDVFDKRVYRILDIKYLNTYEEAKAFEEAETRRRLILSIGRKKGNGGELTAEETAFMKEK